MPLPFSCIDVGTFALLFLPPFLGYFIMAALAVTRHTQTFRMILWPVVALSALRAALYVDTSSGESDRKFCGSSFVFLMVYIVTHTFDWTVPKEPLVRRIHPKKSSPSVIMDALDLAMTLRGQGWDWSRGVYFPRETRPTNRRGFILHVILSVVSHSFVSGVLQIAVQSFSPTGIGSLSGGTIFDDTLPRYLRYFRASVISILSAFAMYAVVQVHYDTCTLVGVLLLGQDPAQWPPAFDAPWRATSVADFWGRRWHQFHRRTFVVQGGNPLSFFLGRPGFIIGTFLSSGILHHIAMVSLNDRAEPWRMLVGFGMMGPAILAERVFERSTGRKVGGVVGRVWAMAWLLSFGSLIIDASARGGVFGHFSYTEGMVPGRAAIQDLVTNFDAWLHG